MKHVSFGDKSLFMGDDAAEALLEYARLISEAATADSVTVSCISHDGNTVEASFLLNANTVLIVETTNSELDPPDNAEAVQEMRDRINAMSRPVNAQPGEPWMWSDDGVADMV